MAQPAPLPAYRLKILCADEQEFRERYASKYASAGIFVPAREPLAVGTRVHIKLEFKTGQVMVSGDAMVTSRILPEKSDKPGMTMRLTALHPESIKFEISPSAGTRPTKTQSPAITPAPAVTPAQAVAPPRTAIPPPTLTPPPTVTAPRPAPSAPRMPAPIAAPGPAASAQSLIPPKRAVTPPKATPAVAPAALSPVPPLRTPTPPKATPAVAPPPPPAPPAPFAPPAPPVLTPVPSSSPLARAAERQDLFNLDEPPSPAINETTDFSEVAPTPPPAPLGSPTTAKEADLPGSPADADAATRIPPPVVEAPAPAAMPAVAGRRFPMRIAVAVAVAAVVVASAAAIASSRKRGTGAAASTTRATEELRISDLRIGEGRLAGPGGDSALDHLLAAKAAAPDDARVTARIGLLADKFEQLGEMALARKNEREAAVHFEDAVRADPGRESARKRLAELAGR